YRSFVMVAGLTPSTPPGLHGAEEGKVAAGARAGFYSRGAIFWPKARPPSFAAPFGACPPASGGPAGGLASCPCWPRGSSHAGVWEASCCRWEGARRWLRAPPDGSWSGPPPAPVRHPQDEAPGVDRRERPPGAPPGGAYRPSPIPPEL